MQQESFSREEADAFYKDLHQRIRDLRKGPRTKVPKTRQLQKAAIEIKEAKLALKREYEEDKKKLRARYQNSLHELQLAARSIRNDRATQLKRLAEKVRTWTEQHARNALWARAFGQPRSGDGAELRALYRAWWRYTNSSRDGPHAYERAAKKCGIEYTITLAGVTHREGGQPSFR